MHLLFSFYFLFPWNLHEIIAETNVHVSIDYVLDVFVAKDMNKSNVLAKMFAAKPNTTSAAPIFAVLGFNYNIPPIVRSLERDGLLDTALSCKDRKLSPRWMVA